jgi:hypothetical protein
MGAVATLQHVADASGAAVQGGQRLDVTIPANSGGSARHVTVDPGRWLVEATLPSGEVISEEVAVAAGQDVPVTFHAAEHSPHEWLGWQYLLGNVEGAETVRLMRERARKVNESVAGDFPATIDVKEMIEQGDRGTDGSELARTELAKPPEVHVWDEPAGLYGARAWTKILAPELGAATTSSASMADQPDSTWLYELSGPATPKQRRFAHVEWLGQRFAVSLPLPWAALKNQRQVSTQMMVRMHPLEGNVQIGVLVQDPDFASMAGLMTASTLPKATIAVKQASHMLFGKMLHPLGAAAGGYVLLAAGEREASDWHGWIDNLDAWFPDIPDGAILKASLRLRFPKTKDAPAEARAALLKAFDRGIPYYSAGVSWLLDGLTAFADDPTVEEKMKTVQRVSLRLDLSQAFTVIRISDKVKR